MTREEAEMYARNMSYEDALFNLTKARAIPYKKATLIKVYELIKALSQEPCSNCCNGNQIEKAKLCQKSYLAGMEHKQEPTDTWSIKDVADTFKKHGLIREQEPYDAISREAVIMKCIKYADHEHNVQLKKEVSETRKHDAQVIIYVCDYFKTFVEKLPSVTQKSGKWIPVSERLPEDLEPVNITWVNHEPEPYYHDIKDRNFVATGIYYGGQWYWYSTTCADYLGEYGSNEIDKVDDAVEIIAWMPLPKPYEPQERSNKE